MTRYLSLPRAGGRRSLRHRDQKGAAVLEFALVFLPFVFILYGLIAFGMMFALKQSMTSAASDAARSAIGAGTPAQEVAAAKATLAKRLSWLGAKYSPTDSIDPVVGACANDAAKTCITVTVTYPYGTKPLIPAAPGLKLVTPSTLSTQATVQVS